MKTVEKNTQNGLKHNLTSNKALTQDTNSTQRALKLNYAKAMERKVLEQENKYEVGLWDEGENTRTRVRCEPNGIT